MYSLGKQIKIITDTVSELSQGTLNNVVVKETELIEIERDKEDFSGDLSRWSLYGGDGIWTIEDGVLKGVGETQGNQIVFDHEIDFEKRFTLKVFLKNDRGSTGVWLGGVYCRRYAGSRYQAGGSTGTITGVLPWDSNWRFEYYPHLKTFDWYVGETSVLSGLNVGLDRKNIMLDVDEPAHTQYFDDIEIIYWEAKGTLELAKLHNQFLHSQSFEECSGEHIGDIADSNGVKTYLEGGWHAATHYNTSIIKINTDGGYHGNNRMSIIHDGSHGWKGAIASISIVEGKWYRVSVRSKVNFSPVQRNWNPGYAFHSGSFTQKFQYDILPFDNPDKWATGKVIFQAPSDIAGTIYLYGIDDGDAGLILDYDAIMWEEFDEDPTGKPFGFTIDQSYPFEGGERVSEPIDLSIAGISQKALNIRQVSTPIGTSIDQYSSIDNGLTWQRIVPGKNLNSNIGLTMNGVDNYVQIPNSEDLHFYDGDEETVEIKVKPIGNKRNYFLHQNGGWSRRIYWENDAFTFLFYQTDGEIKTYTSPGWPANRIYHISYLIDKETAVSFYINNIYVGGTMIDKPLVAANGYWMFGSAWMGSTQYFFEGTIYEARIWQTQRGHSEIVYNWNKHLAGNEPGLAGYWIFNAGEGDKVSNRVYRGDGDTQQLDATINGKAEWEFTSVSGDMTNKSLLLKQMLKTDNLTVSPQLNKSVTLIHPANAILVSDEYKSRCKDFGNRFEHQVTIYNITKDTDITEFVDLSSFSLDASEKGLTGLVNANSLNFKIKTDIDNDISNIAQDGDIIKVSVTFSNETVNTFYGFVNDTQVNYRNLQHNYTVNVFDNLRKGFKGKFEENEVKVGWYLCNNFETDKSLAHYLAGLIGFELDNVILEDITDGVGNHIQVHYAHLEKGVKYITELVTLVKGVQGKLYVNHDNQLVLNSPFNEEDFIEIGYLFDEEIQSEIKVNAIKAKYDSVEVKYDTFMIAERQICWMLYEKQSYDKANDKANMLIKADSESAWIKIELVTPICINLESAPEILAEDASGNDMATYLQYDLELDMTGGKLKLYNLHSEDIYIQKFKIYGEPLEKLSGHEYKYNEVEKPDNPITVSNKYIQNEALAEMNAKYAFHMLCKDRKQFEFNCNHLPFLALSNKVGLKKRDIDAQCLVSRFSHKVSDNHLITSVELTEHLPFEGFAGLSTSISASPNVKDDLQEFEVDKIQNDGIFPEGLPVPVPANVKATGSFKHVWVEWGSVGRKDILGYNIYVEDGSIRKYYTDSNSYMFDAEIGTTYNIQVSAVCLAGESNKSSPAATVTTPGGVDWTEVENAAVDTQDIVDRAIENVKVALAAIDSDSMASGAVGTTHIKNLAVLDAKIGDLAVIQAKIGDLAVATAKIANLAVATAKIANMAVATANIKNLAVENAQIADMTVDSGKIANLAVHDAHILNLHGQKIDAGTITAREIRAGNFMPLGKPSGAKLWHFDRSMISTDGIKPLESVATLRQTEGKYGGAVAVEEETTNILSPDIDTSMKTLSGWTSSATLNGDGSLTFYPNAWYYMSAAADGFCVGKFSPGDKVSFQAEYFLKPEDVPSGTGSLYFSVRFVKADHSTADYLRLFIPLAEVKYGQWERVTFDDYTVPADSHSLALLVNFSGATEAGQIKIRKAQTEVKPFATSFVEGTRSAGRLSFPANGVDINGTTWHFVWKPQQDEDSMTSQASSPKILSVGQYYHNNSFTLWHYYKKIALYIKGATKTGGWSRTIQWNPPSGWYEQGKEYIFDVQIINGNHFKVYLDGQLIIETTISDAFTGVADNKWTLGTNDGQGSANALFDEVLVSPIVHTPEEIKAWYESETPFYDSPTHIGAGDGMLLTPQGLVGYNENKETVKIGQDGNFKQYDDSGNEIVFIGRKNGQPQAYFGGELRVDSIAWEHLKKIHREEVEIVNIAPMGHALVVIEHAEMSLLAGVPYVNPGQDTGYIFPLNSIGITGVGRDYGFELNMITTKGFYVSIENYSSTALNNFPIYWKRSGVST